MGGAGRERPQETSRREEHFKGKDGGKNQGNITFQNSRNSIRSRKGDRIKGGGLGGEKCRVERKGKETVRGKD